MSTEHWTDRLSEYADGELGAAEAAAVERHIAACEPCRTTLAELRQVVAAAAALEDREPATDLLPGILQRIREGDDPAVVPLHSAARSRRRFTFTLPQLAAAAVAIMTFSAGAAWWAVRPDPSQPVNAAGPAITAADMPDDAAAMAARFVSDTEVGYEAAIGQLELALAEGRDQLDPATLEVIERNLEIIDAAIAEARAAVQSDPSNAYLYRHLDQTLNRKVDLLRRATRRAAT
jgi:hypothetical protein